MPDDPDDVALDEKPSDETGDDKPDDGSTDGSGDDKPDDSTSGATDVKPSVAKKRALR